MAHSDLLIVTEDTIEVLGFKVGADGSVYAQQVSTLQELVDAPFEPIVTNVLRQIEETIKSDRAAKKADRIAFIQLTNGALAMLWAEEPPFRDLIAQGHVNSEGTEIVVQGLPILGGEFDVHVTKNIPENGFVIATIDANGQVV